MGSGNSVEAKEFLVSPHDNRAGKCSGGRSGSSPCAAAVPPFRPSVLQQAARAGLHTVQFALAYFLMLLAMYYNGYFIICIFISAFLGAMAFQWETFRCGGGGTGPDGGERTSAAGEATICCG